MIAADFDEDGRIDLFVANDGSPAWLFRNRGGLKFDEVGAASGLALDGSGSPLAGMGVARADLDGDGRIDLAVGNLFGRSTVVFENLGKGRYADRSASWGLPALTRRSTGFGVALEDLDGDGRPDLIQANGHVLDRSRLGEPSAMPTTLARNLGDRFEDASGLVSVAVDPSSSAAASAVGDLDGDARPDVVVARLDGPAAFLRNESPGRFVAIDLVAKAPSPRSAIGARLSVEVGGRRLVREVVGGGSYLSASSRRVAIGLGREAKIDRLQGDLACRAGSESWRDLGPGALIRVEEGSGEAE